MHGELPRRRGVRDGVDVLVHDHDLLAPVTTLEQRPDGAATLPAVATDNDVVLHVTSNGRS